MRDPRGGPNRRMKLIAVVVALLLAGPVAAYLVEGAASLVSAAY